ncbi:MAG: CPBP family intramembrane glutamic endopeptidase [Segetibacter sp.]
MGALIQAVLFGVGHALYFDDKRHLQFYFAGFAVTFVLGAFMTYLKEKGESLIPAILFHNLYNSSLALIRLFI